MELLVVGALVTAWVTCGAFAYARIFAYFQRGWPTLAVAQYRADRMLAMILGILGPPALIASFIACDKGTQWR